MAHRRVHRYCTRVRGRILVPAMQGVVSGRCPSGRCVLLILPRVHASFSRHSCLAEPTPPCPHLAVRVGETGCAGRVAYDSRRQTSLANHRDCSTRSSSERIFRGDPERVFRRKDEHEDPPRGLLTWSSGGVSLWERPEPRRFGNAPDGVCVLLWWRSRNRSGHEPHFSREQHELAVTIRAGVCRGKE